MKLGSAVALTVLLPLALHAARPQQQAPYTYHGTIQAVQPKPGSLDDARLAPFRLPRITPGLQASGRQPAIQKMSLSSCSTGASRPGLPAHPAP